MGRGHAKKCQIERNCKKLDKNEIIIYLRDPSSLASQVFAEKKSLWY